MPKTNPQLILYDGLKSIALEQYPPDAWVYHTGDPDADEKKTVIQLRRVVPWLYRAVEMRTSAVASMPFNILRGDEVVDNSNTYTNRCGFWPSPRRTLRQVERCLTVIGYAYLFKLRKGRAVIGLKYHVPTTMAYEADVVNGLKGFTRDVGHGPKTLAVEDVIYFWPEDESIEVGPPTSSPGRAALNAAGVLENVDAFMAAYFKRGAIKATLLTVEDLNSPAEREKIESWWKNVFSGRKNAFGAKVVNAKRVTPVVIGEGLKELENNTLTREKREEIASALGIPQTKLFSASAGGLGGGGVAMQDDIRFYNETIVPECEFIAEVLNEQLFIPLGYTLRFKPETLDIFQEDENQRAGSVGALVMALQSPEEFDIAASVLGLEMDQETRAKFDVLLTRKQKAAEQAAGQPPAPPIIPPAPAAPTTVPPTTTGDSALGAEQGEIQPEPAKAIDPHVAAIRLDLDRWKRKSLKAVEKGKPANVPFESDIIPADLAAQLAAQLAECQDETAVKAAFAQAAKYADAQPENEMQARPLPDFTPLIAALRDATQALRATEVKFASQAQREAFGLAGATAEAAGSATGAKSIDDQPRDERGRWTGGIGGFAATYTGPRDPEVMGWEYHRAHPEVSFDDAVAAAERHLRERPVPESPELGRATAQPDSDSGATEASEYPTASVSSVPGLTSFEDIRNIARVAVARGYPYDYIGIRTQESDYGQRVGDPVTHQSSVWVEGRETGAALDGTSAIDAEIADRDLPPGRHGGYSGNVVLVLGSSDAGQGEDPGEIIMQNPVVLEVIHLQ